MTREDIIRMAREASSEHDYDFPNIFALERFAALVAEHEREAYSAMDSNFDAAIEHINESEALSDGQE